MFKHHVDKEPDLGWICSPVSSLLYTSCSPRCFPIPRHRNQSRKVYSFFSCHCSGQKPPWPLCECWTFGALCVIPLVTFNDVFTLGIPLGTHGPSWTFYVFPHGRMCSFLQSHLIFSWMFFSFFFLCNQIPADYLILQDITHTLLGTLSWLIKFSYPCQLLHEAPDIPLLSPDLSPL